MYSLVCRLMLDQDLLILLSSYCGWSHPIVICLPLMIHLIPNDIFYLRTCPNLMPKGLSHLFIRFWFGKGLSGIIHCRHVFSNYLLHVAPSKTGSLLDSTLGKLGFFPKTSWFGEDSLTFFREFLAAIAQATPVSRE